MPLGCIFYGAYLYIVLYIDKRCGECDRKETSDRWRVSDPLLSYMPSILVKPSGMKREQCVIEISMYKLGWREHTRVIILGSTAVYLGGYAVVRRSQARQRLVRLESQLDEP